MAKIPSGKISGRMAVKKIVRENFGTKIKITYDKKTTGNTVKRTIMPYEFARGYLYAKDTIHEPIHSFIPGRIRTMEPTQKPFYPVWPLKISTR